MKRRAFLGTLAVSAIAGCSSLRSGASESPAPPDQLDSDWRLPGYDHRLRNYTPTAAGPETEVEELWRIDDDASYSPPVIADGRLFVGSETGVVRALDARDGSDHWEVSVGEAASHPQVGAEYVYVVTPEATVALSPDTGDEEWRVALTPEISQSLSHREETVSAGGLLYTPHGLYIVRESGEACPDDADEDTCPAGAGEGPTTAALVSRLDPTTGELLWEEPIFDPLSTHLFASEQFLFVSSESVGLTPWVLTPEEGRTSDEVEGISHGPAEHCYSDGVIYGVDDWNGIFDGKTVTDDSFETVVSEGVSFSAETLATDGDRCYISSRREPGPPGVACLTTDGEMLWTHELEAVVGTPTITNEVVLYRDSETLYAVDPADGSERWTHPADEMGHEFAIVDDVLYTVAGQTVTAYRSL